MNLGLSIRRFGNVGGMEGVAHAFAHWLVQSGHDVDVWTSEVFGKDTGVQIRTLPTGGRGVLWKAQRLRRGLRSIPVGGYDGFLHFERGGRGGTYRAGAGCHAFWVRQRGARIGDRWLTALDCESMTRARRVVVNSHMVWSQVLELYGLPEERLRLVRNVVDLNRFQPGTKTDRPTIVFPGGQVLRKGLKVAVDAAKQLPDVELLVLGEVSMGIRKWAVERNPRVRFLGRIGDPERILASAHALILPTMYDPSANAVLEAMACGVPVVTTEYDGASELLPHRWMAVADPLNVDACAEVLVAVMNESSLGATCRNIAGQHGLDAGFPRLLDVVMGDVA